MVGDDKETRASLLMICTFEGVDEKIQAIYLTVYRAVLGVASCWASTENMGSFG